MNTDPIPNAWFRQRIPNYNEAMRAALAKKDEIEGVRHIRAFCKTPYARHGFG